LALSTTQPGQVVIVDNSPEKRPLPRSRWKGPLNRIHRPDNPGYGAAANTGVAALGPDSDWVVVCNPDIVVQPDTLSTLLSEAQTQPRVGSLGPAITNEDGSLYPSARALPTLGVGIGHAVFGVIWPRNPWTRAYRGDYTRESTRESGWLSGSFIVLRRRALEEIGGFDEGYFMFFEDVDLGWRLGHAGWKNLYVPSASALHLGGHSTKRNYEVMFKAHHDSAVRFIAKRYPGPLWWPLRALIGLGLSLRERILRGRALAVD
jgi:N-acetylglucosaminyl-diphospho-decaprenol L-rhamnosyltransferase